MKPEEYKEMREEIGLTQASLASRLGVARETIARRESGAAKISAEAVIALRSLYFASSSTKSTAEPADDGGEVPELLAIADELEKSEAFWMEKKDDSYGINLSVAMSINAVRQAVLSAIVEDSEIPSANRENTRKF